MKKNSIKTPVKPKTASEPKRTWSPSHKSTDDVMISSSFNSSAINDSPADGGIISIDVPQENYLDNLKKQIDKKYWDQIFPDPNKRSAEEGGSRHKRGGITPRTNNKNSSATGSSSKSAFIFNPEDPLGVEAKKVEDAANAKKKVRQNTLTSDEIINKLLEINNSQTPQEQCFEAKPKYYKFLSPQPLKIPFAFPSDEKPDSSSLSPTKTPSSNADSDQFFITSTVSPKKTQTSVFNKTIASIKTRPSTSPNFAPPTPLSTKSAPGYSKNFGSFNKTSPVELSNLNNTISSTNGGNFSPRKSKTFKQFFEQKYQDPKNLPKEETDDFVKNMAKVEKKSTSMRTMRIKSAQPVLKKVKLKPKTPTDKPIIEKKLVCNGKIFNRGGFSDQMYEEVQADDDEDEINVAPYNPNSSQTMTYDSQNQPQDGAPPATSFLNRPKSNQSSKSIPANSGAPVNSSPGANAHPPSSSSNPEEILHTQEPLRLRYDPKQLEIPFSSLKTLNNMSIKDYTIMAEACHRTGKSRMEALAYYKLGTIYEKMKDYKEVLKNYKKFLKLSKEFGDIVGESLGLNGVGVTLQKLAGEENLKKSIKYHLKHLQIAAPQSKIVAYLNLGLAFKALKDFEEAAEYFKNAYTLAFEIGDKQGENIALSNLGLIGKDQGDVSTALVCMEKHLQLSKKLKDEKSIGEAYEQLGKLADNEGDLDDAIKYLGKARKYASKQGDVKKSESLGINIGVMLANQIFDEKLKDVGMSLQKEASGTTSSP